uniref:Uncharacterized protein AlNc14C11G1344 n=1 Tax=Albugo laibachii Nc14 TaxID=890382 RepID=F0W2W6_9STRA|nr:conserved hypothetical protein [Albugo laibachii Nc14]|eukprot:CCA15402.1 conserved hypothetical protein [Albugo laibachii Nc14]
MHQNRSNEITTWSNLGTDHSHNHIVTIKQLNAFGVRNISLQGPINGILLDLYFRIIVGDHVIYKSELATSTLNPVWVPFQLEEVLTNGMMTSPGTCFTICVIRVHERLVAPRRKNRNSSTTTENADEAVPTNKTAGSKARTMRYETELFRFQYKLTDLAVLPKSLVELSSLPFNTCLFEFSGRVYVKRDLLEFLKQAGLVSRKLVRQDSFMVPPKQYDMMQGLESLEKSVNLFHELLQSQRRTRVYREKTSQLIRDRENQVLVQQRKLTLQKRISELRMQKKVQQEMLESLQTVVMHEQKLFSSGIPIPRALLLTMRMNIRCKDEKSGLLSRRCDVLRTAFRIRYCQAELVKALLFIYPIKYIASGEYTIRNIRIANADLSSNGKTDEESVSTALGFVAHLVFMLSKYFDINLRYRIVPFSSRSYIKDEVNDLFGEYPLYRKGVDKDRYERAILYLRKDVEQIISSRGLKITQQGVVFAQLKDLIDAELSWASAS